MLVPFTFEISRYSYLISLIRIHVYDATIIKPNYLHFKTNSQCRGCYHTLRED